jgi:hypothetical protein
MTRATCVCWSIASLTSTAHGSRVRRHGRSRSAASAPGVQRRRRVGAHVRSRAEPRPPHGGQAGSDEDEPGVHGVEHDRARPASAAPCRPPAARRRRSAPARTPAANSDATSSSSPWICSESECTCRAPTVERVERGGEGAAGDGVAVGARRRVAEQLRDALLDTVRDDVLPAARLLMDVGGIETDHVGEQALGEPVLPHDARRPFAATVGERDGAVLGQDQQPLLLEPRHALGDGRRGQVQALGDAGAQRRDALLLELEHDPEVHLRRVDEVVSLSHVRSSARDRLSSIGVGDGRDVGCRPPPPPASSTGGVSGAVGASTARNSTVVPSALTSATMSWPEWNSPVSRRSLSTSSSSRWIVRRSGRAPSCGS